MDELEKALRKRMIDKDLPLSAVAKEMNLSTSYVYDLLSGKRNNAERLKQLCEVLDLNFYDYLSVRS